jgi:hypothetical protein
LPPRRQVRRWLTRPPAAPYPSRPADITVCGSAPEGGSVRATSAPSTIQRAPLTGLVSRRSDRLGKFANEVAETHGDYRLSR